MDLSDLRPPVEDGPWPPITHFPPLVYGPLRGARSWTGLTHASVPGYRPLQLDVHVPEGLASPPVVLWVHGGGWAEGDRRHVPLQWGQQRMFQAILDAGMAVATCDYRLNEEARLPAAVHDVVAAVRYLRRYAAELGLDGDRVGLWGDSAGAHLAAVAGLAGSSPEPDPWVLGEIGVVADGAYASGGPERTDVRAVVWWYGLADLARERQLAAWLWPEVEADARAELARRLSPVTYLRSDSPPLLAMMGDADTVAPVTQAHALAEAAEAVGARCELVISPGSGHVFHGEPLEAFWERAVEFLARELGAVPLVPEESPAPEQFVRRNLRGARFRDVDLSGAVMRAVDVDGLEIDAPWLLEEDRRLVVNGVDVAPLVDTELDRRFPGRALRTAATPEGLGEAWSAVEQAWSRAVARAEAMPDGTIDRSVDGEWTFAQTLRHPAHATDMWLRTGMQRLDDPFHPWGLPDGDPTDGMGDGPTWEQVLEVRADRQAQVRRAIAATTTEELAEERPNPHAPEHRETVLSCFRTILEEEWEHLRFATRDLALLEQETSGRPCHDEA